MNELVRKSLCGIAQSCRIILNDYKRSWTSLASPHLVHKIFKSQGIRSTTTNPQNRINKRKSTDANLCQIAGECLPSTVVVLPDLLERRHEFTDHCCTGRFSLFGRFHTVDVAGPAVVTSSSRTVSATANDHLFHGHG